MGQYLLPLIDIRMQIISYGGFKMVDHYKRFSHIEAHLFILADNAAIALRLHLKDLDCLDV